MLAGAIAPDAGRIEIDGEPAFLDSPRAARALGIGVVHQHDALIDALTVAENFELGVPSGERTLSPRRMAEAAEGAARRIGVALPAPERVVGSLSVGERQQIEIARALASAPRLLVLDEPTAALAPQEAQALLEAVRAIASRGVGVIFISHHLGEVAAV